jgi:predicted permease
MLGRALRRIWYLLNRRRFERELEREMASHRAEMGDVRRFGNARRLREVSADVWGWAWLDDLIHDLRYGARQLRRSSGFALAAALTLAVGIAANATGFALVKGALFDGPPIPDSAALRRFEWNGDRLIAVDLFRRLRGETAGFSSATCIANRRVTLVHAEARHSTDAMAVSGAFFGTFRVTAASGRTLTELDDRTGAELVGVVSHEFAQRAFGKADVAGTQVHIDEIPLTIVGVMPPGFSISHVRRPADLILSLAALDAASGEPAQADSRCSIVARLSGRRSEESARLESESLLRWSDVASSSAVQRPPPGGRLRLAHVGRGIDEMSSRELYDNLPAMLGGAFLVLTVLLVPCANVAAMLLARAITRRPEIVARMALGASRVRLVRQLLTEGALLASIAGATGMFFAWVAGASLEQWPTFDAWIVVAILAICALATVSFALAPALNATRGDLASAVREASGGTPGRGRTAPGSLLVAAQVFVCCVLLAAAALQSRTLVAAARTGDAHPERLIRFDVQVSRQAREEDYVESALTRLNGMTGVASAAALAEPRPLSACEARADHPSRQMQAWVIPTSPGLFKTMNMALTGRDVSSHDTKSSAGVAVVNEALARTLFSEGMTGSQHPVPRSGVGSVIGQRLPLGQCGRRGDRVVEGLAGLPTSLTIVGVVADVAGIDPGEPGKIVPAFYLPYRQAPRQYLSGSTTFVARTMSDARAMVKSVEAAMPPAGGAVLGMVQSEAERLERSARTERLLAALYLLLGVIASAQATFGLYGTIAQFVNRRTAEIALRRVLGAGTRDLAMMVVRQAMVPVIVGLLLGVACSPLVAQVMAAARVIPDAGSAELLMVSAAVCVLMLPPFAAAFLPLWRASRSEPAASLRQE